MIKKRLDRIKGDDCVTFGDFEDDCQKDFSLKSACRELTKELINHRGELTGSERKHLLELIEAASHMMQYY